MAIQPVEQFLVDGSLRASRAAAAGRCLQHAATDAAITVQVQQVQESHR